MSTDLNPHAAPTAFVEDVRRASEREAIRREHLGHEASVRSIGTMYYAGSVLWSLFGVYFLLVAVRGSDFTPWPLAVVSLVFGLASLVVAWGLRGLQRWAAAHSRPIHRRRQRQRFHGVAARRHLARVRPRVGRRSVGPAEAPALGGFRGGRAIRAQPTGRSVRDGDRRVRSLSAAIGQRPADFCARLRERRRRDAAHRARRLARRLDRIRRGRRARGGDARLLLRASMTSAPLAAKLTELRPR